MTSKTNQKRVLVTSLATILMISAVTMSLSIQPAHATLVACGANIIEDTTLDSDLNCISSNGLIIGENDITLNCDGHSITGNGAFRGIDVFDKSNVIIKNCIIEGFNFGVLLSGSDTNTLTANSVNNNNINGIQLGISGTENTGNYLIDNTFNNNGQFGIHIISSSGNTITHNTANENNSGGIFLFKSPNNIIEENITNNNRFHGISTNDPDSKNNMLTKNISKENGNYGFRDDTSGAGTERTANIYNKNICWNNLLGGSSPFGLCTWSEFEVLIDEVKSLELPHGSENSLIKKLENALFLLEKGNVNGACGKLRDFIDAINAQNGNKITEVQADSLIAKAQTIQVFINC